MGQKWVQALKLGRALGPERLELNSLIGVCAGAIDPHSIRPDGSPASLNRTGVQCPAAHARLKRFVGNDS